MSGLGERIGQCHPKRNPPVKPIVCSPLSAVRLQLGSRYQPVSLCGKNIKSKTTPWSSSVRYCAAPTYGPNEIAAQAKKIAAPRIFGVVFIGCFASISGWTEDTGGMRYK